MNTLLITVLSILMLFSASINGQAINTLKGQYPNFQTQSYNGSWFIVPVNKTVVPSLVRSYSLLSLQNNPPFPGFYEQGKHPVMVIRGGCINDIHMGAFYLDSILQGGFLIRYVDGTGDGVSPCTYSYDSFVSGFVPSKPEIFDAGYLPLLTVLAAIAASLFFGTTVYYGLFDPNNSAYEATSDGFLQNKLQTGVPNFDRLFSGIPFLIFPTQSSMRNSRPS